MAVSAGRRDSGQEAWSTGRQQGSQGPLGRRYPEGGGQMGSGTRVFSDRWMAVTLISPPPASRWPLPPPLPLKGHLHMALLPPGSHPIIYTLYAHTLVLTGTHTQTQMVLILRDSQSTPAPGDWARKHSLSRLNPGVSFPLRPSSHSQPPPSDFGHNTDGIVIKFQITFSLPL